MGIKDKIFSRKLWITILLILISVVLRFFEKLDDLYFTVIVLSMAVIYIFIEGAIDVQRIKIKSGLIEIESNVDNKDGDTRKQSE
jgi:amino acid permease